MATTRIKDAPFTRQEKQHLIEMGIEEADWGHPGVTLGNPIEYFRERIKLNDDPSIQLKGNRRHLPALRGGSRKRPSDVQLRQTNIISCNKVV